MVLPVSRPKKSSARCVPKECQKMGHHNTELIVGALIKEGLVQYMGVSENSGTPKSSILIGFSIINHPFWGTPIFGNTHKSWKNCTTASNSIRQKQAV